MKYDHALFLDRDGTVIEECEYLLSENNIKIEKGLKELLLYSLKKKFKIIMVTNQTVVSRGLLTYEQMEHLNDIIIKKVNSLLGQNSFHGVFICPYHPDAQVLKYKYDSEDRKPKAGMLKKARDRFKINFKNSFMVGDRVSDIVAGNSVCCTTILKVNKFSKLKMIKSDLKFSKELTVPDYKVEGLDEIIPIMEKLF